MSDKTKAWRILALTSYLGLTLWVILWHLWLAPHQQISPWGIAIAWLIPLLFPLIGIIKGKPYTHAWANFVLMLYFLHALSMIYLDEGERLLAFVELLLTSLSFVANIYYARHRGRELGLKLTKLSQVEKNEKALFTNKP
ncbi:DUF2069 domain-containing protein [Vibrio sp. RC27]